MVVDSEIPASLYMASRLVLFKKSYPEKAGSGSRKVSEAVKHTRFPERGPR